MNADFSVEDLRLGKDNLNCVRHTNDGKASSSVYKTKRGELFLKGPIPRSWLQTAGRLPGEALHVGIELWYYAGLKKSRTVKLNLSRMGESGIGRDSARRGLYQLEQGKLVTVRRHPGRNPIVSILVDAPETKGQGLAS